MKKSIKMSKQQSNYAVAKAMMDAANKISAERLAPYEYLLDFDAPESDTAEFDKVCSALDKELNIKELAANLKQAEDEMVNWANDKVSKSKHFSPRYKQAMVEVMAAYEIQYSIRTKVIDLAFRLA